MKQFSTLITIFRWNCHRQCEKMREPDNTSPKKLQIPKVLLLCMLWVCTGLTSLAQTMTTYPGSLSATITECNGSTTKTFTIENRGADNLTYTNSITYDIDGTRAGNILGSYSNFPEYSYGMVKVGSYLYLVNTNNYTIDKYNISTQSVVASYPISDDNPAGIAYDGEHLWVGSYYGYMQKYDLSGNKIGSSVSLPFNGQTPALTYDGQYFIVAPCNNSNPTIYRVDKMEIPLKHSPLALITFGRSPGFPSIPADISG